MISYKSSEDNASLFNLEARIAAVASIILFLDSIKLSK